MMCLHSRSSSASRPGTTGQLGAIGAGVMTTTRLVELDGVGHTAIADRPGGAASQGETDAGVDVEALAFGTSTICAGKASDRGCHGGGSREETGGEKSELKLHNGKVVSVEKHEIVIQHRRFNDQIIC